MLKVPVKDISSSTGMSFAKDVSASDIGLGDDEVDLRSPLSVTATLTRVDNTIIAQVAVSAQYGYQCARCLGDFQRSKLREFYFDYEVESQMDAVNIGEDIRQEMILSIPQRVLCSKDCKGICSGCGVNLNLEKCKCK
jgi:uncharacterized protein